MLRSVLTKGNRLRGQIRGTAVGARLAAPPAAAIGKKQLSIEARKVNMTIVRQADIEKKYGEQYLYGKAYDSKDPFNTPGSKLLKELRVDQVVLGVFITSLALHMTGVQKCG
ncbi:MAG: hypothetical protein Hyperionvirus11_3 [Hyperionvirus sp.]|uniref:Uncharacterized protein n=1 Tax=Hyperionvirus sp. TaxID=2487770 RepID=A0A3G5A8X9_9VIRU|nr:MAG: hypothetical protein Hyperionvirus11_3 [Hyperionvirus sp.]